MSPRDVRFEPLPAILSSVVAHCWAQLTQIGVFDKDSPRQAPSVPADVSRGSFSAAALLNEAAGRWTMPSRVQSLTRHCRQVGIHRVLGSPFDAAFRKYSCSLFWDRRPGSVPSWMRAAKASPDRTGDQTIGRRGTGPDRPRGNIDEL